MPINSNIALGFQPTQLDIGGSLQKGMSLRDMKVRAEANDRAEQERVAMSDVLKKYSKVGADGRMNVDRGAALSELTGKVDQNKVLAFQKQLDDMDTESLQRVTQRAKQYAWSANKDNYAQIRQAMIDEGMPNAEKLPEYYSPQFVERWQIGTLDGEKQLQYRMDQEKLRNDALNRADQREERRMLAGVKKEEAREKYIEGKMQNLSKDVAGTQEMIGALDEVEKLMGGPLESFEQDEDGDLTRNGEVVDLPGASIPGWGRVTAYSTAARDLNAAASRVFNATLKDRSGGAVTDNEMERLRKEFNQGKFNTEPELVAALQRYKRQTAEVLKNREAAYNPEVVARYTNQGGRTSKTLGAKDFASQTKEINGTTYVKVDGGWLPASSVGQR